MTLRSKSIAITIIIVIIAIFSGLFVAPIPDYFPLARVLNALPLKLGLDLQGGAHLVYEANVADILPSDREKAVEGARDVIERRINALGVSEPVVQTNRSPDGAYRVIVELAGVFDISEAKQHIGETPLLEFKEIDEEVQPVQGSSLNEAALEEKNQEHKGFAQAVLDRATTGEEFAALATEYSQDPGSAQQGGDLGFVKAGVFVPEFDAVLFSPEFETGTVWPELVETTFGWHSIKKIGEREIDGEHEVQSRHILIRKEDAQASFEPVWKNTELTGKQLKRAELLFDQTTGSAQVGLTFDNEGAALFKDITARNIGKPVAIFLDGTPLSVPVVQQEISGGQAVISGQFTVQEAKLLAQRLQAGALPVPIQLISQQTVGPSLGRAAVAASLKAGVMGLFLTALFMIIIYRLPGFLSVVSLAVYALLLLALFQLLGVTITLAGVAGFILSLGLAVDANVLIFERMKEELRRGRSIPEAIEVGFIRAWSAIRDSNVSSLLTAIILYWFGSSLIRGFAITLSLGIIVSMFTAIVATRSFLRLFPHTEKFLWLFGVSHKRMKAD